MVINRYFFLSRDITKCSLYKAKGYLSATESPPHLLSVGSIIEIRRQLRIASAALSNKHAHSVSFLSWQYSLNTDLILHLTKAGIRVAGSVTWLSLPQHRLTHDLNRSPQGEIEREEHSGENQQEQQQHRACNWAHESVNVHLSLVWYLHISGCSFWLCCCWLRLLLPLCRVMAMILALSIVFIALVRVESLPV